MSKSQPASPTIPQSPINATSGKPRKRKMSASHKQKIREAMQARKAAGTGGGGITVGPIAGGRLSPIETLRSAARGSWTPEQINAALNESRRETVFLESLYRACETEQAMNAGGGDFGGNR